MDLDRPWAGYSVIWPGIFMGDFGGGKYCQ